MAPDYTISVSLEGDDAQCRVRWSPNDTTQGEIFGLADVLPTLMVSLDAMESRRY